VRGEVGLSWALDGEGGVVVILEYGALEQPIDGAGKESLELVETDDGCESLGCGLDVLKVFNFNC
jgi:hypothetical protein